MDLRLNIACGRQILKDPNCIWINIDKDPKDPNVCKWEFPERLPIGDSKVRLVYIGHFFIYLNIEDHVRLLQECWRVLKNKGILIIKEDDDRKRIWLKRVGRRHHTGRIMSTSNPETMERRLIYAKFMILKTFEGKDIEQTFVEYPFLKTHKMVLKKSYVTIAMKNKVEVKWADKDKEIAKDVNFINPVTKSSVEEETCVLV